MFSESITKLSEDLKSAKNEKKALEEESKSICDFYPLNIVLFWKHLKHFDKRRYLRNHFVFWAFADSVLSTTNIYLV